MKKLFIVLLVAAVGAGAYFFLQKKNHSESTGIQKELLIGKWTINSFDPAIDSADSFLTGIMGLVDSNSLKYQYVFTSEGTILRALGDSITRDSSRFEWNKQKQLVWKDGATDSTGTVFSVIKLNKDSLLLRDTDSVQVLFLKTK